VPPQDSRAVVRQAWTLWGLPGAFRVDNGVPWGSAGDLPTDLALWVLGMGVGMIWNPPHTPQRNGVIERFQGVGQQWAEPWLCRSAAELQQRLEAMDRLQREEYPVAEGKSRMQAFPGLAHSGRPYDLAWEEAHWSLDAVVEHLAGYSLARRVDRKGMVSIYNRNHYVGSRFAGQPVWVFFDPEAFEWVFTDANGCQLRQRKAEEISRERIMALDVTNRRPPRGQT
jgi:hypothetical protein